MNGQISVKRTVIDRREPGRISIYPVQSFETRRERIVFHNARTGFFCNGQMAWQPCPPQRSEFGPWTPLTRIRT